MSNKLRKSYFEKFFKSFVNMFIPTGKDNNKEKKNNLNEGLELDETEINTSKQKETIQRIQRILEESINKYKIISKEKGKLEQELELMNDNLKLCLKNLSDINKFKENGKVPNSYQNEQKMKDIYQKIKKLDEKISSAQEKQMRNEEIIAKTYGTNIILKSLDEYRNSNIDKFLTEKEKIIKERNCLNSENKKDIEILERLSMVDLIKIKNDNMSLIKGNEQRLIELDKEKQKIEDEIKLIEKLIVQEEWRFKYIKYARDNFIIQSNTLETNIDSLYDIVGQCNEHRQHFLLFENNNGDGQKYICSSDYCKGHWSGKKSERSCNDKKTSFTADTPDEWKKHIKDTRTGNMVTWDPYDILQFNIKSDLPIPFAKYCSKVPIC